LPIEESGASTTVIRIVEPSNGFPEMVIEKGQSAGIFTSKVKETGKLFFQILCEPNRYCRKLTINEIVANQSAWLGRAFTHLVIPDIWNESLLWILKNKPRDKHFIIIAAGEKSVRQKDLSEISRLVSEYTKDGAVLTITDSRELIEAVCDSVTDEKGEEIFFETGPFFFDLSDNTLIEDIDKIEANVKDVRIKKILLENKLPER